MLDSEYKEIREKEGIKILAKLDKLSLEARKVYLEAYSDALEYAREFYKEREASSKLEANLP